MSCPCGTDVPISECCGRFHSGEAIAQTPEQLMRSRYAAFCVRDSEYLIASHHPSKHLPDDREHLTRTMDTTEWLELRILETARTETIAASWNSSRFIDRAAIRIAKTVSSYTSVPIS